MTAHSKYLASLLNVFSTFLESHSVSKDLAVLTTEFFVVFISNKKNYGNWSIDELEKFLEAENVPSKPAFLLKKFLKEYTPHEVDVFLHEFLSSLKLDNKSDSTIKNYRSDVQQLVEHSQKLQLKNLFKPEVVRDFIQSQLDAGLKKSTIKRKIISISQFATWAESENILEDVTFWLSDIDQILEKNHSRGKFTKTFKKTPQIPEESHHQEQKHPDISPQEALKKYLVTLEIDQHSPATIKNYKSDISQFIDQANAKSLQELISEKTIVRYVTQQKREGLQISTIKRKVSSITQFALWAESRNLVKSVSNWIDSIQHTVSSFEPKPTIQQSPTQQTQKNTPFQLKLKDLGLVQAHQKPQKHSTWTLPTPGFTKNHTISKPEKNQSSESSNKNTTQETPDVFAEIRSNLKDFANQINVKRNRILLPYINLALLLIFVIGLGYLAYQQFILQTPSPLAFPSTPVRPNRELSFQGRLTDTAQNPITSSTDMAFRLYDNNTGGTQLWSSGTCSVTPDQDGIFNVGLGDDCGSEITEDVFSENSNVWLEVEVDSETLTPRQSIKTVPYALNSETVQGYPVTATGAATVNTILTMDSAGNVLLGEVSPRLRSTSGTFAIEAQTLSLQTSTGSNGNILLSPDGTGKVIVQSDLDLEGYLHAPGATLSATYAGGTSLVVRGGPSGSANIQEWQNSAGTALSVVDENGNVGIGTNSPGSFKLEVAGNLGPSVDATYNLGSSAKQWQNIYANGIVTATGLFDSDVDTSVQVEESADEDKIRFDTAGVERMIVDNVGNVGIGTNNPTQKLQIDSAGNISFRVSQSSFSDFFDFGIQTHLATIGYTAGTATDSQIDISTNGVSAIRIDDEQNVGIGSTTPQGLLDVRGRATGQALVQLQELGDQDILTASNSAGTTRFRMANNGYMYAERFADISNSTYYLDPAASGTSLAVVSNAGIGTATPDSRLHVAGAGLDTTPNSAGFRTGQDGSGNWGMEITGNGGIPYFDFQNDTAGTDYDARIGLYGDDYLSLLGANVGIGTTTPDSILDIVDTSTSGGGTYMTMQNTTATGWSGLVFHDEGNSQVSRIHHFNSSWSPSAAAWETDALVLANNIEGINLIADGASGDLEFFTGGHNQRMIITSAGNVGIGSTSPQYALDIGGSGDGKGIRFDGGDAFITTHDGFGNFSFLSGIDDDNVIVSNAGGSRIEMSDSGAIYHEIYSGAVSATGTLVNTFAINGSYAYLSGGNMGIGDTTPDAELEVNGDVLLTGNVLRNSHSRGFLVGGYNNIGANSTNTNPIFTIGTNYLPTDTGLGNMYGIGYSHTNASFITNPGTSSWGQYVAADGDARIWFGASSGAHSYFNTGGNIGINSTSPNAVLSIDANISTNNIYNRGFFLDYDKATDGTGSFYLAGHITANTVGNDKAHGLLIEADNSSTGGALGLRVTAGSASTGWSGSTRYAIMASAETDSDYAFYAYNGQSYFADNVGIGTVASAKLDVWGQANLGAQDGNNLVYVRRQNSTTEGGHLVFQRGGSYTSDVQLDSYGNDFRLWNGPATTSNASFFNNASGQVMNVITDGTASDFAETVYKAESMQGGDIIFLQEANNEDGVVAYQANSAYDNRVAGIISTAPGTTLKAPSLHPETGEVVRVTLVGKYTNDVRAIDPNLEPLALSGRVPVKVIARPGEIIDYGNAIVSSDKKGIGQKATKPGISVGRAITRFRPSTMSCTPVNSVADINWPADPEGNNAAKPCFRLPDGSHVGKVMVMVQTAYVDPNVSLAEVNNANLTGNLASGYGVQLNGQNVSESQALLGAVIGNLRAGITNTKNLVVEQTASINNLSVQNLTINGQTLADYIASIVGNQTFSNGEALVSPLGDDTIINIASDSGQIAFNNENNETVTTISENGDVSTLGTLLADKVVTNSVTASGSSTLGSLLVTNNATVSGTLTANNTSLGNLLTQEASVSGSITVAQDASVAGTLIAGQIEAASSRIAALEAGMAQLEYVKATTAELTTATVSGTLYADNIYDFENKVTNTLKRPGLLELLAGNTESTSSATTLEDLYATVNATELNASSAAELDLSLADLTNTQDDVIITGTALFIEKYFKVNGAGYVSDSLAVGNSLFVGDSTQISDGVIAYNTADPDNQTLQIQPSGQGSIELLAGLVTLDDSGTVTVNGDFFTTGNARIEGTLLTDLIQPTDFGNPLQVQVAGVDTQSNELKKSRFEIINEVGAPVATFSAEGDAEFTGSVKADGGLKVASQDLGSSDTNELSASKTSGKATIKSGASEVVIKSELITNNSLVYVTAVGSTNNQVLYVKAQTPENTDTSEKEGQFTVGFDNTTTADVTFNWWIVN